MSAALIAVPTMQDTIRALTYQVPDGRVDVPFCYTFDASTLADSTGGTSSNAPSLAIQLDNDSDFILRRVAGMNLCLASPGALAGVTGAWNGFDRSRDNFFLTPIQPGNLPAALGGGQSGNWPVLPEKEYLAANVLAFSLQGILRNFTPDTTNIPSRRIYNSQIGFWGVRRFRQDSFYVHNTTYPYHELPYTYTLGFAINWGHWVNAAGAGIANNPRRFTVQVLETDFELCSIGVTYASGGVVTANDFQMTLYAPDGYTPLSSSPMNVGFFNGTPTNYRYGNPVFPTPTLVYPVKTNIKMDIVSMLPYGTAQEYVIHLNGIWRARN